MPAERNVRIRLAISNLSRLTDDPEGDVRLGLLGPGPRGQPEEVAARRRLFRAPASFRARRADGS